MSSKERLTRKDLWSIFRRQIFIRSALNFERHQASGFANAMVPIAEKYYDTKEEKAEVLQRHMQLFLTQPMISAIPVGISAAMEERIALEGDIDKESVNAVKMALMGPLAALGDSIINGTIRPLIAGIAISLAQGGSALGPILFFLVMSAVSLGVRYFGVFKGYEKGVTIVDDIQKSGLIFKLTDFASIAAYTIIGGFIPAVVSLSTKLSMTTGETVFKVQEQLDALVPGILPLGITLLMYYLFTKRKANPIILMLLLMVLGVVGVYLGIF